MKVNRPTNGAPPIDGIDQLGGVGEVDQVSEAPATGEVVAPAAPAGPGNIDPVSQVAAQLRAGEITVDQAVEKLIDDAISRQLGGQAPTDLEKLEPKPRELLRSYV